MKYFNFWFYEVENLENIYNSVRSVDDWMQMKMQHGRI